MKETKRTRIGDLAKKLAVERFVIRFWEEQFSIKPKRSTGGQRWYTKKDVDLFTNIKELLYIKKFTIAGAKQFLKEKKDPTHVLASTRIETCQETDLLLAQIANLKTQLCKLKKSLQQL